MHVHARLPTLLDQALGARPPKAPSRTSEDMALRVADVMNRGGKGGAWNNGSRPQTPTAPAQATTSFASTLAAIDLDKLAPTASPTVAIETSASPGPSIQDLLSSALTSV